MAGTIERGSASSHLTHVTNRGVDWNVAAPMMADEPGYRFWDIWEQNNVDPYTLGIIEKYAKPGTTVVDCGAWIGPMSMWAAHCGARVVAVEPDPLAQEFLHYNVLNNDLNVEIFDGAVGSYTGTTYIAADAAGWGSSMSRISDSIGNEVACLTLPDLFDIYDIDNCSLVKMDIEGFECKVLETAAPFLAGLRTPLLVAMHQPWWSNDVQREWFSDFSYVIGECGGFNDVLAIP